MKITLPELLRNLRHYYLAATAEGEWTLAGGILSGPATLPPGWVALVGPGAPGGVHLLGAGGALPGLPDAHWTGEVHSLQPPAEIFQILDEINAWLADQEALRQLALQRASAAAEAPASTTETVTVEASQPAEFPLLREKESFGAYSHETERGLPAGNSTTTRTVTTSGGSAAEVPSPSLNWAEAFRERLRPYRRMFPEVSGC